METLNFERPATSIPSESIERNKRRAEVARTCLDGYNLDGLLEPTDIVRNLLADLMWLCACDDKVGSFEEHLMWATTFFNDEVKGRA